jgi:prepilin-type N-terminal cleavage/methylation domain-containing protein
MRKTMKSSCKNGGFTLVELILVIIIIGIVASVAFKSMLPAVRTAREEATMTEMENLARAIVGNPALVSDGVRTDFGYVGDVGSLPPDLDALVANPGGYSTWKGPYIMSDFAEDPDDFKRDAWGNPYTYSGVIISSTGGGSPVTIRLAGGAAELISNTISGNVYDALGSSPGDSSANVTVTVYYPDGNGSMTSSSTVPAHDGSFDFSGIVPVGNHLISSVYSTANDTTAAYVSVTPGSVSYKELRFSSGFWSGS